VSFNVDVSGVPAIDVLGIPETASVIDAVAPARTVPALAPVTLNTEPLAMLAEYVIGAGPVFVNEYV
jgi:hypothetical protein